MQEVYREKGCGNIKYLSFESKERLEKDKHSNEILCNSFIVVIQSTFETF